MRFCGFRLHNAAIHHQEKERITQLAYRGLSPIVAGISRMTLAHAALHFFCTALFLDAPVSPGSLSLSVFRCCCGSVRSAVKQIVENPPHYPRHGAAFQAWSLGLQLHQRFKLVHPGPMPESGGDARIKQRNSGRTPGVQLTNTASPPSEAHLLGRQLPEGTRPAGR